MKRAIIVLLIVISFLTNYKQADAETVYSSDFKIQRKGKSFLSPYIFHLPDENDTQRRLKIYLYPKKGYASYAIGGDLIHPNRRDFESIPLMNVDVSTPALAEKALSSGATYSYLFKGYRITINIRDITFTDLRYGTPDGIVFNRSTVDNVFGTVSINR